MLPYALRDPYRLSHYASEEYRGRWPNAGDYLDTLEAAADGALLDIIMPGSAEYHTAHRSGGDVGDVGHAGRGGARHRQYRF